MQYATPHERACARWLLMAHDRVNDDRLPLTQEFLSQMLGVRRGADWLRRPYKKRDSFRIHAGLSTF